jgi:hypothetical protein
LYNGGIGHYKIMRYLFIILLFFVSFKLIYCQESESETDFKYTHHAYIFEGLTVTPDGFGFRCLLRAYYFNVFGYYFGGRGFNKDEEDEYPRMNFAWGPTGFSIPIYTHMYFKISGNLNVYYVTTTDIYIEEYRMPQYPNDVGTYEAAGIAYETVVNFESGFLFISLGYRRGPLFNSPGSGEYRLYDGISAEIGLGLGAILPHSKVQRIKKIDK